MVLWLWFHTVLDLRNLEMTTWDQIMVCSSGLLSTCIPGKAEHMLAFWQGHVDNIADTHASSTYQRIQINSLFGRISASALDARRRGGGLYREAFQPPVLCRRREPQRRATRKWLLEHVSVCPPLNTKRAPTGHLLPINPTEPLHLFFNYLIDV